MKISTPKTPEITNALAFGGGAVAGGMASKGANHFIDKTKEPNTRMAIKGAIAVASFLAIAAIKTDDAISRTAKGALLGAGAEKTISLVTDLFKDSDLAKKDAEKDKDGNPIIDSDGKQFVQKALGLRSPSVCGCSADNQPRYQRYVPMRGATMYQQPFETVADANGTFIPKFI